MYSESHWILCNKKDLAVRAESLELRVEMEVIPVGSVRFGFGKFVR
jgi:hypothetical protein